MLYYDRIDVSGIDVNKTSQESVMFVFIGVFLIIILRFNQMSAVDVMIY